MARKIAFIGAGSFGFTRALVRDILTFPALADSTIALMDVDSERLAYIKRAVDRIVAEGNYSAKVIATMDRKEALTGADGVLCTILAGDVDVWQHDILIPKKYGVDTNVGDTRGPSGIFRYLRTVNPMLEIAADIDRYCPEAVFLNYTNPMAMLCRTIQGKFPHMTTSGLCHSVQGTAAMLAKWIGAQEGEYEYTCAGINHQAFYTEFLVNGKDAYPLIRKAVTERPEVYNEEIVRNEMFLALGYYVTESSGHNSEYNAWFRKRPDLIEKYCTGGTSWNPGEYAFSLNLRIKRKETWPEDIKKWIAEKPDTKRGQEYAANIFNAIFGDNALYTFNGNVLNTGLIDNLPENSCVEVPVLASKNGIQPMHVGSLPAHLATLVGTTARIEDMIAEAAVTGDRRLVLHAVQLDPLTSAVCSLEEIDQMVNLLFEKNRDYLPAFF